MNIPSQRNASQEVLVNIGVPQSDECHGRYELFTTDMDKVLFKLNLSCLHVIQANETSPNHKIPDD